MAAALLACALGAAPAAQAKSKARPQRYTKDGATVEVSLTPPGARGPSALREGDAAELRLRITDATSGQPLRGREPAAWIDVAREGVQTPQACREKVGLFLKGLVGVRPMVDLNSYFLLVLNQDPSISVIDPVVGMTGKTNLFATIVLRGPGADWVTSRDGRRLFVSMPRANRLAVVDTESFKVISEIDAGLEPARLALQADGRYLWVGNDALAPEESGVTIVDTDSLAVVGRVPTGRGHHEIAFSAGDRHAFVVNRDGGSVTAIEVASLRPVKELKIGGVPISVAFSPLSQLVYVAEAKEGFIAAIDPTRLEIVSRLAAEPGLGPMRFSQDGRWGVVVNSSAKALHVIDASHHRVARRVALPGRPYQVAFTRAHAYVRLLDSERVAMLPLLLLAEGGEPALHWFAAGTAAPQLADDLSLADSIAPASTEAAVFVADPAGNMTHFYMEGMNAPGGSFANYGHNARAVTVVDRSLREVAPGVYAAHLRAPAAGSYTVAFLLDAPRILHCVDFTVAPNPALSRPTGTLEIEYLDAPGNGLAVRFRLADPASHEPARGLADVRVLAFQPPGRHRTEVAASEVSPGVYEARLPFDDPGAWFAYVGSVSKKVKFGDLPYRTVFLRPLDYAQEERR